MFLLHSHIFAKRKTSVKKTNIQQKGKWGKYWSFLHLSLSPQHQSSIDYSETSKSRQIITESVAQPQLPS